MVLPIMCVLEPIVCICVGVFSQGKRRHWINGVEIKKDKSSVFSVWPWVYTTTTTWECNWTASGDAENKTMSHSSELQSCCKFYLNSIRKQCWRNIPLNYNLLWRFISGSVIEHALPFSLGEKMKRHSLFSLTLLVLVSSARSKVRERCSRSVPFMDQGANTRLQAVPLLFILYDLVWLALLWGETPHEHRKMSPLIQAISIACTWTDMLYRLYVMVKKVTETFSSNFGHERHHPSLTHLQILVRSGFVNMKAKREGLRIC